jgi:pyridoxal phosphate enzyme (YggS family)
VSELSARLEEVRRRIARAAERAGRTAGDVQLVAVSKRHPAAAVREAYALGVRVFGENYAQELVAKAAEVGELEGIAWHMIGHLQTNKARRVAPVAACVQTIDSAELAAELAKRAARSGRSIDVLLEVNVARDPAKSGCAPPDLGPLIDAVLAEAPSLRLRGLMTMPRETEDPEGARPVFAALRALRDAHGGPARLPDLSMGMSDDFEIAIEEGATLVRVGTALFGERPARDAG